MRNSQIIYFSTSKKVDKIVLDPKQDIPVGARQTILISPMLRNSCKEWKQPLMFKLQFPVKADKRVRMEQNRESS